MTDDYQKSEDEYLKSIIKSKQVEAVIKVGFITFASGVPEELKILAYEGNDDKIVYYHWINRLNPTLKYEPYVCNNKTNVLRLFDILNRDLTGLNKRVYFFVDKDFDGLQGRVANEKIFITCKYSIENYLVDCRVLNDLLKIDFHCSGYNQFREEIITKFQLLYSQFLEHTKQINFRIFLARKLKIKETEHLPSTINLLANVNLEEIFKIDAPLDEIVKLEREPTTKEIEDLIPEFESLDKASDYRGKFSLFFFSKWLSLLREDRCAENPIIFNNIPKTTATIRGDFSLLALAPKSEPPEHLYNFLAKI